MWQYNKERQIHALYILLNDNLYADKTKLLGTSRKAVSTHEFTHCAAALMTISRMKTDELIRRRLNSLKGSFHALERADIQRIFSDVLMLRPANDQRAEALLSFNDSHFRTGDEDFQASYSDLYRHLLLSYAVLRETFTDDKIRELAIALSHGDSEGARNMFRNLCHEVAETKLLDEDFVWYRVSELIGRIPQEIKRLAEQ